MKKMAMMAIWVAIVGLGYWMTPAGGQGVVNPPDVSGNVTFGQASNIAFNVSSNVVQAQGYITAPTGTNITSGYGATLFDALGAAASASNGAVAVAASNGDAAYLQVDGGNAMAATLNMASNNINNVSNLNFSSDSPRVHGVAGKPFYLYSNPGETGGYLNMEDGNATLGAGPWGSEVVQFVASVNGAAGIYFTNSLMIYSGINPMWKMFADGHVNGYGNTWTNLIVPAYAASTEPIAASNNAAMPGVVTQIVNAVAVPKARTISVNGVSGTLSSNIAFNVSVPDGSTVEAYTNIYSWPSSFVAAGFEGDYSDFNGTYRIEQAFNPTCRSPVWTNETASLFNFQTGVMNYGFPGATISDPFNATNATSRFSPLGTYAGLCGTTITVELPAGEDQAFQIAWFPTVTDPLYAPIDEPLAYGIASNIVYGVASNVVQSQGYMTTNYTGTVRITGVVTASVAVVTDDVYAEGGQFSESVQTPIAYTTATNASALGGTPAASYMTGAASSNAFAFITEPIAVAVSNYFNSASFTPYTIPWASSNALDLSNGNYQWYEPTNTTALWFPESNTNQGHVIRIDFNPKASSLTLTGSVGTVTFATGFSITNSGTTATIFSKPKYSTIWKGTML